MREIGSGEWGKLFTWCCNDSEAVMKALIVLNHDLELAEQNFLFPLTQAIAPFMMKNVQSSFCQMKRLSLQLLLLLLP